MFVCVSKVAAITAASDPAAAVRNPGKASAPVVSHPQYVPPVTVRTSLMAFAVTLMVNVGTVTCHVTRG
jgi:hypothetical protein